MRPSNNLENKTFSDTSKSFFFFNWNSLHATLNSHYKAWSYKKKKKKAQKILQATENLFRKNLQLKDVC